MILPVWGLVAGLLLSGSPTATSPPDRCLCATTRATNGWCAVHGFGYVGGLKIESAWLYEALDAHGHDLDLTTFTCSSCKKAIAGDGWCDEHRTGFVRRQAYFSKLTYGTAKAEAKDVSALTCAACRKNAGDHGWCAKDKTGMVGPYAFRSRADYDEAVKALEIVRLAAVASKRCDHCAGAIITDRECPFCLVKYKDGKPVH